MWGIKSCTYLTTFWLKFIGFRSPWMSVAHVVKISLLSKTSYRNYDHKNVVFAFVHKLSWISPLKELMHLLYVFGGQAVSRAVANLVRYVLTNVTMQCWTPMIKNINWINAERRKIGLIYSMEGNAKCRHLKNWPVWRDFAAVVYLSEARNLIPPPHTVYVFTVSVLICPWKGGKAVYKAGSKILPTCLTVSPTYTLW